MGVRKKLSAKKKKPLNTNAKLWVKALRSGKYRCICHVGICPLHEVPNLAREKFADRVCTLMGFDRHSEPYSTERHDVARAILHSADFYAEQVLNTYSKSGGGV